MNSQPTDIHQILRKYWGYDCFRPLQEEIINSILDGHDTLGLLPTGGGKSLTFQVPALMLPGVTLVVTPLISLMKDQIDNLAAAGLKGVCLHSGLTRAEHRLAMDRCRLGKAKFLYVSPERLQSDTFVAELRSVDVSLIVVDEAHCISQWGYDFRPSYLKISALRRHFPDAPVLALTASATPEVVDDIKDKLLFRPGSATFRKSFSRPNISYIVRDDTDKETRLLRVMTTTSGSAVVYVRSRRRTREIAAFLAESGISADYYHAGLSPEEKDERQQRWKDGRTRAIVATNAFGMGIDKSDVRVVVHLDLPPSLEEYYQEAGRAGRDGLPAFAVLIVSPHDKGRLTRSVDENFPPKDFIRRVYELVGNFTEVAVGEGFGHLYEFNTERFYETYKLPPRPTRSALLLLTQAGYIEYTDEVATQSRVYICTRKEELYAIHADQTTDLVLNTLLRTHTGLFADFVNISEHLIATNAGVTEEQVYQSLLTLSRMKILQYVPRKNTPYVYYTTSRELPKHLIFPRSVYEEQRERFIKRIEAVKRFASAKYGCRVDMMLRYFGESPDAECGTCDLCRDKTRKASQHRNDDNDKALQESILYMARSPRSLDYLIEESSAPPERVTNTIRNLIKRGRLRLDPDGMIHTK